jgi:putative nucleotidyltransferase with HDIG domain
MTRARILIVEDDESITNLYKKGLSDDVYEKRFSSNGKEALEIYNSWNPDIIVLDIMLPVMTGYSVLKEIRATLGDRSTTIIMATSLSKKDDIQDCVKFGIHGYIVKPFKYKDIGARIMTCYQKTTALSSVHDTSHSNGLSTEVLHHIAQNKQAEQPATASLYQSDIASKIMKIIESQDIYLPSVPQIIFDIAETISNDHTNVEDMAKLIRKDPAISFKLVSLANSPYYRGDKECRTVDEAILRMGFAQSRETIYLISNRSFFCLKDARFEGLSEKMFLHSLACAAASKALATLLNIGEREHFFAMGLLHDIGKLLLLQVLSEMTQQKENLDMGSILGILDSLHTKAGKILLSSRNFPQVFSLIAEHHHDISSLKDPPRELALIHFSDLYTRKLGYSLKEDDGEDPLAYASARILNLKSDHLDAVTKEINDYMNMIQPMLHML